MTESTIKGPAWIPTFLAALAQTRKVGQSIEAAGISPHSVYFQRKTNSLFADAWEAALKAEPPAPGEEDEAGSEALPTRNAGWRALFFETLAATSNLRASAATANVPLRTVRNARRSDPAFAAQWLAALHEGYDYLEMEVLGYLRDPAPRRKMDVAGALRLLAAHRATVERHRALEQEEDEQTVRESIDAFLEGLRQRRLANEAILLETQAPDVAE